MDKLTFYSVLRKKLADQGIREDYIDRHISQFDEYFKGKNDAQIEEEISHLGDLDRVAARIKRMTDKMVLSESGIPLDDSVKESEPVSKEEPKNDPPSEEIPADSDTVKEEEEDIFDEEFVKEAPLHVKKKKFEKEVRTEKKKEDTVDSHLKVTTADEDKLRARATKFRIIFICLIPFIAVLYALTAAVFVLLFFVTALLTILASFLLAAVTIVGSLVFLFGMIFGIVQALSSLPVGIYECGLAVIIGGIALVTGILLYNFAVRLMPYVASQILRLMKYIFRKYRIVYIYFKKEYMQI